MRCLFLCCLLVVPLGAASPVEDWLGKPPAARGPAPEVALSRREAETVRRTLAREILAELATGRAPEVAAKAFTLGDKTLKWLEKDFGRAGEGGPSLWISLHGGGGTTAEVNDGQWRNQIRLYQPEEGIYIAPRGPTDTWNLWHQDHIDPMFDRLIADMVAVRGVNPDKVYLLGYSAGGDGVWQLAPRMADRLAAAAMMAGHPGDASLLPLRNLPFALFMGGEDAAYERNRRAAEKAAELADLQKADPAGYTHLARIYPGLPHWMDGKDAEALPWMAKFSRNPLPRKVIWVQDDVTQRRFYWLEVPAEAATAGRKITATVDGNAIALAGDVPPGISLHLADPLVDLDQPVTVMIDGREVFSGKVERNAAAIAAGLRALPDAPRCAFAVLKPAG